MYVSCTTVTTTSRQETQSCWDRQGHRRVKVEEAGACRQSADAVEWGYNSSALQWANTRFHFFIHSLFYLSEEALSPRCVGQASSNAH